jgi:hypothetical protein
MSRSVSTPLSTSHRHRSPHQNDPHEEAVSYRFHPTNRSSSDDIFDPSRTPSPSHSPSQPHSSHHHSIRGLDLSPPPSAAPSSIPYEDPDETPNYRRAYRIEHSHDEEDRPSREEVIKLMQDLEKVSSPLCHFLSTAHSLSLSVSHRGYEENTMRVSLS